jgi:RNA polymerase sigma-70 factor (ECF subfamily)
MTRANTSTPPALHELARESEEVSAINSTLLSLEELVHAHVDVVWRSLRRFGVPLGEVDDATQQVFLVANSKRDQIRAGNERGYLMAVALKVASNVRRAGARRETAHQVLASVALDEAAADPEQLTQQRQARELLDRVLGQIPDKLRTVFVLSELEELTISEIANLLVLPPGTVATRIRRARVVFHEQVAILQGSPRGVEL